MHTTTITTLTLGLAASVTMTAGAAQPIPEPDVVLYGGILLGGVPVNPAQTDVVVIAVPEGGDPAMPSQRLATYTIGATPGALVDADDDGQVDDAGYVLRLRMEFLPMGAVQTAGAVIVGDQVDLYVQDPPAAPVPMGSYTVAGRGTVTLADLPLAGKTCPADLTGHNNMPPDGFVDTADFLALLQNWGPCPTPPDPCPWDLTGHANAPPDGFVDTADFLALLQNWGPCP